MRWRSRAWVELSEDDIPGWQSAPEKLRDAVLFWCASALALFVLAVVTFVGLRHGNRLAGFCALLGLGCSAIALAIQRARHASE
jgi:hypothetical protein